MIFCLQPSAMLSVAAINLHICLHCYLNRSEQATSKNNSTNSKSLISLATKFGKKLSSFYTMTILHQQHAHLAHAQNNTVKPRLTATSVIQSPCYSAIFLDAWQNGHTFSCKRVEPNYRLFKYLQSLQLKAFVCCIKLMLIASVNIYVLLVA